MTQLREENIDLTKTLIFLTVFGLGSSQLVHNEWNARTDYNSFVNNNDDDTGFTMNTPGCTIPKMKVNEQNIDKLIQYPWDIIPCPNTKPLLRSNQTHIWTVVENLEVYKVSNVSLFQCCYRSFHRLQSSEVVYLDCIIFDRIIEAGNEFVNVECYYEKESIHKQFFVFVPKKPFNAIRKLPIVPKTKSAYNVIILGMSSVSRLNFQRVMPLTFKLLKELGAIELNGYHAIADSTLDNIMPVLAGMSTNTLNITHWPGTQPAFDRVPFLWERFKDAGYYTAVLEDTARSRILNSNIYGFNGIPADYYLYPFLQECEKFELPTVPERKQIISGAKNFLRLWKTLEMGVPHHEATCMGDSYFFHVVLDYIERLTAVLKTSKLFGLFWESSFQQNVNAPIVLDLGYKALINKLNRTGYLNETVLILLSDHGMSHGDIQQIKQGRLEQRLPLAVILMPPPFRETYSVAYESLQLNSHRLTTPYDLHESLIDLLFLDGLENTEVSHKNKNKFLNARGMSLFVPIHSNRTCESANIEEKSCTCQKIIDVNFRNELVLNAATFMVTHLNLMLKLYPLCAQLEMDQVVEFQEMWPSYAEKDEWQDFRFVFILKPGAVKYEALLRNDDQEWSLLAHVRRLREYTGEGWCVHDNIVKVYCQCL